MRAVVDVNVLISAILASRGASAELLRNTRDGEFELGGHIPVNPSGGLKAKGHPIGATGVSMHAITAMQLTGQAGTMQLPKADIAAKNYDLSLNRYREVVQETVHYDPPEKILDELDALEGEIQQGLARLRIMLQGQERTG